MPKLKFLSLLVVSMTFVAGDLGAAPAASEEKTSDLVVKIPAEARLVKPSVRIYRQQEGTDWPDVHKTVEGGQGARDVSVPLVAGEYAIEVGGVADDGTVTLLRRRSVVVPRDKQVAPAWARFDVTASIGKKSAQIVQLAARRAGGGEVRWKADAAGDKSPKRLILTPGETYGVSCVAETPDAVLAVWQRPVVKAGEPIKFDDARATKHVTFTFRKETPELAGAEVGLGFPDTRVVISNPAKRQFLTDSDRALLDYGFTTKAGEDVVFRPAGVVFGDVPVEIGGDLEPRLFATFLSEETGNGWKGALFTRLDMADGGGRLVDSKRSKFGLAHGIFTGSGKVRRTIEEAPPAHEGFDPTRLIAEVRYDYGGKERRGTCTGEGYQEFRSEHFRLKAPPAWEWRANAFLAMLEQVRPVTANNTGRPGPKSFNVDWRANGNNAKSIVGSSKGGGRDLWMSFPFWTFESFWDPFAEPWFGNKDPYVCHEMLHAFGYQHGEELSRLEWKAEAQYRDLRWRSVDSEKWAVWPAEAPK